MEDKTKEPIIAGFIKVENLNRWFINFQGRTYYTYMDGAAWWVVTNKNGIDIRLNQVGYKEFCQVKSLLNMICSTELFAEPSAGQSVPSAGEYYSYRLLKSEFNVNISKIIEDYASLCVEQKQREWEKEKQEMQDKINHLLKVK